MQLALSLVLLALAFVFLCKRLVVVADYEVGLRVRFGRVAGRLEPGLRLLWPGERAELSDLREQSHTVPPQEITTGDKVPVKASVVVTYKVVVPEAARAATASLAADLHRAAQVALRETLARFELEALLASRAEASAAVQALLAAELQRLGLEVVRAVVLDVVVRGDLKTALSEVVKARAEARAKLERARGETAALRSLANAARMLREHGGLYELRALEAAQLAAGSSANTLVLGLDRKGLELSSGGQ